MKSIRKLASCIFLFIVLSKSAELLNAQPQNDELVNAIDISNLFIGSPLAINTGGPYTNDGATLGQDDPMEPDCFIDDETMLNKSVWFVIHPSQSGNYSILTSTDAACTSSPMGGTSGDTEIALYDHLPLTTDNSISAIACADDYDLEPSVSPWNSLINFYLEAGQVYYLLVDSWDGQEGEFCINVLVGGQSCGNDSCEPFETYSNCADDCDCIVDLRYVDMTTLLITDTPSLYCSNDVYIAGPPQDPPMAFLPFVILFSSMPLDNEAVLGEISLSAGVLYNANPPPTPSPDNIINGFIFYIGLTADDLLVPSIEISFNNLVDGNCSGTFNISTAVLASQLDIATECAAPCNGNQYCNEAEPCTCSDCGCEMDCTDAAFGFTDIYTCYNSDVSNSSHTISSPNPEEYAANGKEIVYAIFYASSDGTIAGIPNAVFASQPFADTNIVFLDQAVSGEGGLLGSFPLPHFGAQGCEPFRAQLALVAGFFDPVQTFVPLQPLQGDLTCFQIIDYYEYPPVPHIEIISGNCDQAATVQLVANNGDICAELQTEIPTNIDIQKDEDCNEYINYSFEYGYNSPCDTLFSGILEAECECLGTGIVDNNNHIIEYRDNEVILLNSTLPHDIQLRIVSIDGKQVCNYTYNEIMNSNYKIDLNELPSGIHLLSIQDSEDSLVIKIVVN